jgi:uncharacterized protein YuzE
VPRKTNCKKVFIKPDICYIRFYNDKKQKYSHSILGFETIRGEELIVDVDKSGRVIGIELLGSQKAKKPCQSETWTKKERAIAACALQK